MGKGDAQHREHAGRGGVGAAHGAAQHIGRECHRDDQLGQHAVALLIDDTAAIGDKADADDQKQHQYLGKYLCNTHAHSLFSVWDGISIAEFGGCGKGEMDAETDDKYLLKDIT